MPFGSLRRRRLLGLFGALFVWGVDIRRGGEDPSLVRVREKGAILFGLDPSYPPFAGISESGELGGFDVDFAAELARRLDVRAQYITIDSGSLLDAVITRKCDAAVGIVPLRDNLRDLRHSLPYFNAGQVLVRPEAEAAQVTAGLAGRQVGVELGSNADLRSGSIAPRLSGPTIVRYGSIDSLEAAVRSGEITGMIVDRVLAYEIIKKAPDLAVATSEPLTQEPYVIALHKDDTALLRAVNSALQSLESDGTMRKLAVKWLG